MKKILLGLLVVVTIAVGTLFYLNSRNRTLSPPGKTELTVNDLTITISYSQPSVRGRVIFGDESEGALQPYGKYWRLGANEPTQITFTKNVTVNGESVKAGSYRLYAMPGKENFEIRLNSEISVWGAAEPDYSKDILITNIPIQKPESTAEQLTIALTEIPGGMNLVIEWADVRLVIPIQAT